MLLLDEPRKCKILKIIKIKIKHIKKDHICITHKLKLMQPNNGNESKMGYNFKLINLKINVLTYLGLCLSGNF